MEKPVSIAFSPQSRADPAVTISADEESEEPVETTLLVTPGEYYAIRADVRDFEDGFCIVKALQANSVEFDGIYFKRSGQESDSSVVWLEETPQKDKFNVKTIIHGLIIVFVEDSFVSIDVNEFEDIVASVNEE